MNKKIFLQQEKINSLSQEVAQIRLEVERILSEKEMVLEVLKGEQHKMICEVWPFEQIRGNRSIHHRPHKWGDLKNRTSIHDSNYGKFNRVVSAVEARDFMQSFQDSKIEFLTELVPDNTRYLLQTIDDEGGYGIYEYTLVEI